MHKADLNWSELGFGYIKTKCHLEFYFRDGKWSQTKIVEDDKISIGIASTCLHYGQECFEGLKVFETKNGDVQAFRVDENAKRMKNSAERILMQPFPEEKFIEAVMQLVSLNREYIPPYGSGASLYIRPLLIGVSEIIGVKPSKEYIFLVFCTPVGPYFKTGMKPIRLRVEEQMDRAAPNGVGDVKVGGNYAASLKAAKKAEDLGFPAVLYVDPKEKKYIDESGPANFFGITHDNKYVTPKSASILPSITNKSLMTLAEDMGMTVEQRPIHISELETFKEAGCCGTAAVITPVKSVTYRDNEIVLAEGDKVGEISKKLYDCLTAIQTGDAEDKFRWNTKIPID